MNRRFLSPRRKLCDSRYKNKKEKFTVGDLFDFVQINLMTLLKSKYFLRLWEKYHNIKLHKEMNLLSNIKR